MDVLFLANAVSHNIFFHDDDYIIIKSLPSRARKAEYFLENVIEASMIDGNYRNFTELLNVMEEHELDLVVKLAKLIKSKIDVAEGLKKGTDTGQ